MVTSNWYDYFIYKMCVFGCMLVDSHHFWVERFTLRADYNIVNRFDKIFTVLHTNGFQQKSGMSKLNNFSTPVWIC